MSDTLPWIIAGACALWAIVATIIAVDNSIGYRILKQSEESTNSLAKMRLESIHELKQKNAKLQHHAESAHGEASQLRARIEAARKALEEET